jgi:ssDNA-binding Zn-finger/Zn-ribbon topoisomerase 1
MSFVGYNINLNPDYPKSHMAGTRGKMLPTVSISHQEINISMQRAADVLCSEFFLRIAIGSFSERDNLWKFIKDDSDLQGDPIRWTFELGGAFTKTSPIAIQDGDKTWRVAHGAFGHQDTIHFRKNADSTYYMKIWKMLSWEYVVKLIDNTEDVSLRSANRKFIYRTLEYGNAYSALVWNLKSIDDNKVRVEIETRGKHTDLNHAMALLVLLKDVSQIDDFGAWRVQRDHFKKIESEKVQKAKQREQIQRCLKYDLCMRCEQPVVQRRQRKTGLLFFGCSGFEARNCNETRPITCPICSGPTSEKQKRAGGTFIGCNSWPKCSGGRNIAENLEMERWSRFHSDDDGFTENQSLDELAREWGWANWAAFDDSREGR